MTIHKELSAQEHSSVKLTLTVAKDDLRSRHDEILDNYAKTIQIPGFRKGKTPRDVLLRKFGDALNAETLGTVIEKALEQVFQDENLSREERPLPYSTPRLEDEPKLDLEQDLSFSVVYDVLPKITVGAWKGLEAEAPEAEISDDDINRELEAVRERNAIVLDRDDNAAAEKGDVVTVNYCELNDEGAPLPGSERQDFVFTLGTGYNIYKFDDEVLGMKKGETKEFAKTYPPEEANSGLAGKTVKLRVSLSALKERKLPELDDDLAQDVDEKFQTLEDLKNNIKKNLTENLERRLREIKISRLLEKILADTPVDVPESMIRIELESRWRNMARRLNTTAEQLITSMEKNSAGVEGIQNEWRPEAVKALQSRLIVETLMEDLKLEAGEEDLNGEIEKLAAENDSMAEDIRKYYQEEQARGYLEEEIKERKLFDILLAENTIKPGKKENYLDLVRNNG
ncbi:MAG: trigger factor [Treponema sp.]|nr:trigger factor [Treponema sp.]